ncbi:MAG: N-acetyltransferase, partial [Porphyrobacter sp.]|nr:N-acetyltransferase [Porphyrobacter sp.]
ISAEARGKGIAMKLVEALVADAREQGFTIEPQCSYVVAAFRRHPEWADLRAPVPS